MAAIIQLFDRARRRDTRVELDVPVALVHECGTVAVASGSNVSSKGLQIVCSRLTLDSLYRSDLPVDEQFSYLDAHFMLPLFQQDPKVDARCRLVYTEQRGAGEYVLGLEFLKLWGDSRALLNVYLAEHG